MIVVGRECLGAAEGINAQLAPTHEDLRQKNRLQDNALESASTEEVTSSAVGPFREGSFQVSYRVEGKAEGVVFHFLFS